jgi:hypothetical protein
MSTHVLVLGAVLVLLLVGVLNLIESRRTRRVVEAALGPRGGRGLLGETMISERPPPTVRSERSRECETRREPAARPRVDLEALDESDQARAVEALAPPVPAPPEAPSAQAGSASAPAVEPDPAIVAVGLGARPEGVRSSHRTPHAPPRRRVVLASATPASSPVATQLPPAVPPPRRGAASSGPPGAARGDDVGHDEEQTRVVERTLPSMAAVVEAGARPAPSVQVIAAGLNAAGAGVDEDANTVGRCEAAARTSSDRARRDGAAS